MKLKRWLITLQFSTILYIVELKCLSFIYELILRNDLRLFVPKSWRFSRLMRICCIAQSYVIRNRMFYGISWFKGRFFLHTHKNPFSIFLVIQLAQNIFCQNIDKGFSSVTQLFLMFVGIWFVLINFQNNTICDFYIFLLT